MSATLGEHAFTCRVLEESSGRQAGREILKWLCCVSSAHVAVLGFSGFSEELKIT